MFQRTVSFHNSVVCCQSLEFIWSCYKRKTCEICNIFCNHNIITFWCIKSSSNRSSTKSQFFQMVKRIINRFFRIIQLRNITREFLTKSQRRGVHKMCSSDFYNILEFLRFFIQSISQFFQSWKRIFYNLSIGSNVHCCWISIVGRLRFVHIIIRMNFSFFAQLSSAIDVRFIGNNLVYIHIRLCSRTSLPNNQRKLVIQFSCKNLVTDFSDCISFFN